MDVRGRKYRPSWDSKNEYQYNIMELALSSSIFIMVWWYVRPKMVLALASTSGMTAVDMDAKLCCDWLCVLVVILLKGEERVRRYKHNLLLLLCLVTIGKSNLEWDNANFWKLAKVYFDMLKISCFFRWSGKVVGVCLACKLEYLLNFEFNKLILLYRHVWYFVMDRVLLVAHAFTNKYFN